MIGLKKRRRIQLVILASFMLIFAASLIGYGFRDGISYFHLPSEVLAQPPAPGESFRLGGLVGAESVLYDEDGVHFAITDGDASVPVLYSGILPDLFAEKQGVVALGHYRDGRFVAIEVLAKHDETYMPAEVADALKDRGLFQPAGQ